MKVKMVFNSLDIHKRYEATDHFFLELEIGGQSVRIDVGLSDPCKDGEHEFIHINGPCDLKVVHQYGNALGLKWPINEAQP